GGVGIDIERANNNIIGGTTAGARNVLSGNVSEGLLINKSNQNDGGRPRNGRLARTARPRPMSGSRHIGRSLVGLPVLGLSLSPRGARRRPYRRRSVSGRPG